VVGKIAPLPSVNSLTMMAGACAVQTRAIPAHLKIARSDWNFRRRKSVADIRVKRLPDPVFDIMIDYVNAEFSVTSVGKDSVCIKMFGNPVWVTIENARELARQILHVTGKEKE